MAKRDEDAFLLEEKKYQNIVRKREAKEREEVRKEKEKEEEAQREKGEKEGERKNAMHDSLSNEKSEEKGIEETKDNDTLKLRDKENNVISDLEVEVEEEEEVESEIEAWGSVEILPCEEKDYLRKTVNTDPVILKHRNSFTEYSYPEIDLIDAIPNTHFSNTSYQIKYKKDSNKDEIINNDYNNNNNNDNNDNNNNNKSNSGKFSFIASTSNKFRSENNDEKSNKTNSGKYKNKSDKRNNTETVNTVNSEDENVNVNESSRRRSMSESYFMENQSKQALVPLHLKTFSYMHTHLLGELCY